MHSSLGRTRPRGEGILWSAFALLCLTWILGGCLLVTWRGHRRTAADQDGTSSVAVDWPAGVSHTAVPLRSRRTPLSPDACLPRNLHLSPASDVMGHTIDMTVSFMLDYKYCADANATVIVSGSKLHHYEAVGPPLQFQYTYYMTPNATYQSDYVYHVRIPDLQANRRYDYRIRVTVPNDMTQTTHDRTAGDTITSRLSPQRSLLRYLSQSSSTTTVTTPFYSFPTPPLPHTPTTIALIGDLGQTSNSTKTMAHILRASQIIPSSTTSSIGGASSIHSHPVTLWTIVGDLSYSDSDPYRWESWFATMQPLLRTLPLVAAAGNHEIECDHATPHRLFQFYENYFSNPNRIQDAMILPPHDIASAQNCSCPSVFRATYEYGNSFYAYTHGLARMIVLNSYTHSSVGSVQYNWLVSELQLYNRTQTPWLLVLFHAPFYNTFHNHVNESEATRMKTAFEPLFVKYGVNLVVNGHVHAYMRTHPMKYDKRDPQAPIYIIIGSGGNREGHNTNGYEHNRSEPWVASRDTYEFGYGHLHLPNSTFAHWSWVRDGTTKKGIHDEAWIRNQYV